MAVDAILKIAFLSLLIKQLSDFSEILHLEAERHAHKGHATKTANVFKIQGGGRPPF